MKKTKPPDLGPDLYWDGVAAQRCVTCRQIVRMKGGAPVVPLLVSDVEVLAQLLTELQWTDTAILERLQQAAGRTVAQMKADR